MSDNTSDQSWRTPPFRQKIVAQIDEAIRQCSSPIGRNSAEMESHVYNKAKTKDEYLSFVARLILHIREMKVPLSYFPSGVGQQNGPTTQQAAAMGSLLATQNPQLGAALSNNPMGNVGATSGGMQGPPVHGRMQSLIGCLGNGPQRAQLPPNTVQMQPSPMGTLSKVGAKHQQAMSAHQQKQMQHNVHHVAHSPQPAMVSLPPGMSDGQMMMIMRDPNQSCGSGQFFSQSGASAPRQSTPNQFLSHSPGTVQGSNHGGMVPSPAQQIPPNMTSSQMAPSPAGYLPSQSPQIVPSPVGCNISTQSVRTPGMISAPSPGSALNTPATIGIVSSPVNRNSEDKLYLEKVKQLSKYIEPLRRMIARIDKDEDKKKEQSKMKNLLDILSNPSKRLPMDTLLKCEQVLEKLELKVKPGDPGSVSSTGPASHSAGCNITQGQSLQHSHHQIVHHLPGNKEYNVCQPLLDAIVGHFGSPTFSHTLQRTFAPAVAVLHGSSFRNVSPPTRKKSKLECVDADIPDALQGEIARLDQRFKVNLDTIQNSGSKTVHLVCQLDDRNLPCVPPITMTVPSGYPKKAPLCKISSEEYESTQFLQKIYQTLLERLAKMPDQFSITSALDTWEMSVRQACSVSTRPAI